MDEIDFSLLTERLRVLHDERDDEAASSLVAQLKPIVSDLHAQQPADPVLNRLLGTIAVILGDGDSVLRHLGAQPRKSKDLWDLEACAEAYRAQGSLRDAEACYREALSLAPEHAALLVRLAEISMERGDPAKVLLWLQMIDEIGAEGGGDAERSRELQESLGAVEGTSPDLGLADRMALTAGAFLEWGRSLRGKRLYENAAQVLDKAAARFPEDALISLDRANTLAEEEDWEGARDAWAQAWRIPGDLRAEAAYFLTAAKDGKGCEIPEGVTPEPPVAPDLSDVFLGPQERDGENLARVLGQYGFAITRGWLDPDFVAEMRHRLERNLERSFLPFVERQRTGTYYGTPLTFLAGGEAADRLHEVMADGAADRSPLEWRQTDWERTRQAVDISDVIKGIEAADEFRRGVDAYFGGASKLVPRLCFTRSQKAGRTHFLPHHQDGRAWYWQEPVLTTWIPLTPCGETAPGVEILPFRFRSLFPVRHYSEEQLDGYRDLPYETACDNELIPDRLVWTPTLEPGDIVLFDNLVVHRTQHMSEGNGLRLNLDLRFVAG